ncbi:MAG: hypothetical protein QM638_15660 [Nocardioides sp.]|uniref:hypothetical protein n=1 Tax=Nocardioides sp. TaxID=35761 RepID=UPI0039E63EA1
MVHDDELAYCEDYLGTPTLTGWTYGRTSEGTWFADGPCPACGGRAYGPLLPPAPAGQAFGAQTSDDAGRREFLARCHCSWSHHRPAGTGCGRTWQVVVPPGQDGTDPSPTSPAVSAQDVDAERLLDEYAADELARVQGHAQRWTAGLAAVIAVLSTATVIGGPGSVADIGGSARVAVVILVVVCAVALVLGVYLSYQAAFGTPLTRSPLDDLVKRPGPLAGRGARWREAVAETVRKSRRSLVGAVAATLAATGLLLAAFVVLWVAPAPDPGGAEYCVRTANGVTVLRGDVPAVRAGTLPITACTR